MRWLLLVLFLLSTPIWASDANVSWGPLPTATGYTVHLGIVSGTYPNVTMVSVASLSYDDGTMFQGVRNFLVVTASNVSGTSGFSEEINGFPRPVISSAVPLAEQDFIRMTVLGTNFSDGISAANINLPGMTILAVTWVNVNQILFDYRLDPGTPNDPVNLTVSNEWSGDAGFLKSVTSEVFIVPAPGLNPPPVPILLDIN